jgi:hypothetical protein
MEIIISKVNPYEEEDIDPFRESHIFKKRLVYLKMA